MTVFENPDQVQINCVEAKKNSSNGGMKWIFKKIPNDMWIGYNHDGHTSNWTWIHHPGVHADHCDFRVPLSWGSHYINFIFYSPSSSTNWYKVSFGQKELKNTTSIWLCFNLS